ncbi:hypothetical protein GCM10009682_06270 [Luedemannella flava]|uniref:Uncharacterized protein n=1 Tax=Luedemannella flava TaxID=349316 RepID=A0ABN2LFV6_9ACTN
MLQRRFRIMDRHDDAHLDAGRPPGTPAAARAGAPGVDREARYRGLRDRGRHITNNDRAGRRRRG